MPKLAETTEATCAAVADVGAPAGVIFVAGGEEEVPRAEDITATIII